MINGDDTLMGQTKLLTSNSGHGDELIARPSKDPMLTVLAIGIVLLCGKNSKNMAQRLGKIHVQ